MEQISMMKMLDEKGTPLFEKGDAIFVRELDFVIPAVVSSAFYIPPSRYREKGEWRYVLDLATGGHDVKGERDLGSTLFAEHEDAEKACLLKKYDKIHLGADDLHDAMGFRFTRDDDGRVLTSTVAKYGDIWVYERGFMCYAFLRRFKTEKERDKEYKKLVTKVERDAQWHGAERAENNEVDPLYRVSADVYASRGYAKHHGIQREV